MKDRISIPKSSSIFSRIARQNETILKNVKILKTDVSGKSSSKRSSSTGNKSLLSQVIAIVKNTEQINKTVESVSKSISNFISGDDVQKLIITKHEDIVKRLKDFEKTVLIKLDEIKDGNGGTNIIPLGGRNKGKPEKPGAPKTTEKLPDVQGTRTGQQPGKKGNWPQRNTGKGAATLGRAAKAVGNVARYGSIVARGAMMANPIGFAIGAATIAYQGYQVYKAYENKKAKEVNAEADKENVVDGKELNTKEGLKKTLINELSLRGITDKKAQANILAQIQAESNFVPRSEELNKYSAETLFRLYGPANKGGNKVRFKTIEEAKAVVAKGPKAIGDIIYGGRMGNSQDEGYKYRGRGLVQLTGKDNYNRIGKAIGEDLVSNPDRANEPEVAVKIAAEFYKQGGKGKDLTDIDQVNKITGSADAKSREKRVELAKNFHNELSKQPVQKSVQQPTSVEKSSENTASVMKSEIPAVTRVKETVDSITNPVVPHADRSNNPIVIEKPQQTPVMNNEIYKGPTSSGTNNPRHSNSMLEILQYREIKKLI